MPAYVAFGLRIQAERELPDGVQAASFVSAPDVTIRWAEAQGSASASEPGWFEFSPGLHRFGWPEVGTVEIRAVRVGVEGAQHQVTVHPVVDVAAGLVEHVLLGPVIADILLSRGFVPLHASANCVSDQVVAFVGRSGQGKSTLAAALHRLGHDAHADDLLAVPGAGEPRVSLGISRIKLNPDSARSTGDDPSGLPVVYAGTEKRSKAILSDRRRPARPLRAIYRVLDGDALSIRRLEPRVALLELVRNCFRVEVEQHAVGLGELMRRAAHVATRVPMFDLVRPRDLTQLERVARAVSEHANSVA